MGRASDEQFLRLLFAQALLLLQHFALGLPAWVLAQHLIIVALLAEPVAGLAQLAAC